MSDLIDLQRALYHNDLVKVSEIIASNPSVLFENSELGTCVHTACNRPDIALLKCLVTNGADVNALSPFGDTPLCVAAGNGYLQHVILLLENGARISQIDPIADPGIAAIQSEQIDILKFLLSKGYDPQVVYRGESGSLSNALAFSRKQNMSEIAAYLESIGCRMPVEGVDAPVNETAKPKGVGSSPSDGSEELVSLMSDLFGPVETNALIEIVPVHDVVHVAIHVIRPTPKHPFTTLFTTGMSSLPMTVPGGKEGWKFAELMMRLPPDWPIPTSDSHFTWPIEWMRKIAYFPHFNSTWLGGEHTIVSTDEPPIPLGPNTEQSCLLLLADFAGAGPLELHGGKRVHLYLMMPIYKEERDFEKQAGVVALLKMFRDQNIETTIAPHRPRVFYGKAKKCQERMVLPYRRLGLRQWGVQ